MHITPLAGLRFRLPCENKNLSANADATLRRRVAYLLSSYLNGNNSACELSTLHSPLSTNFRVFRG
ncbi:MAG: hypothetical protein LBU34_03235 [Planctomycetaceae bacterium]|nr:hypothetical protein [Planctomycetaceae bacterium]